MAATLWQLEIDMPWEIGLRKGSSQDHSYCRQWGYPNKSQNKCFPLVYISRNFSVLIEAKIKSCCFFIKLFVFFSPKYNKFVAEWALSSSTFISFVHITSYWCTAAYFCNAAAFLCTSAANAFNKTANWYTAAATAAYLCTTADYLCNAAAYLCTSPNWVVNWCLIARATL